MNTTEIEWIAGVYVALVIAVAAFAWLRLRALRKLEGK